METAMNNFIKPLPHQSNKPLSIERDWSSGHEIILINGVRYSADYFRALAHPETDVLYAVRRDDFGSVTLTTIRNVDEAKEFFEEIAGFDTCAGLDTGKEQERPLDHQRATTQPAEDKKYAV